MSATPIHSLVPLLVVVSFLPHLVIPALVALAFLPVERRRALAWAPLVWVADLDYVLQSQHRAITHSALIPLALAFAIVVLWRRRDPTARLVEFASRPGAPANLMLASFYLASHLVMDVFQGGVVLLWPFVDTNFYYAFQIVLDTGTNTFDPASDGGTSQGAPDLAPRYTWFSTEHAAYAGFLLMCAAAWFAAWRFGGRKPRPVVLRRVATRIPDDAPLAGRHD